LIVVRRRHDNPHAERAIRERDLRRWRSTPELVFELAEVVRTVLEAAAKVEEPDLTPARRAYRALVVDRRVLSSDELHGIGLSKHELAFRRMLADPVRYARWARDVRAGKG
jgi:hypothetical protein